MTPRRVALIGCGEVARTHLAGLRRLRDVAVVAVCDRDRARAEGLARQFAVPHWSDDTAEMLAEARPDVVHVLTPSPGHGVAARTALEADCHALVEKPLAATVAEADALLAIARTRGLVLGVCHNHLFDPAVLALRTLHGSGALGAIRDVDVAWGLRPPLTGHGWLGSLAGGMIVDPLSHPLYLVIALLGPVRVVAAGGRTDPGAPRGGIDDLHVLLAGDAGSATIRMSRRFHPAVRELTVRAATLSLRVDLRTNSLVRLRREAERRGQKALANLDEVGQVLCSTARNAAGALLGRRRLGHETLIERFYRALREGGPTPVPAEDGRAVLVLRDRILESLVGP